jgi:eukaryotic-like serine/threonine-protein kinase
VAEIHSLQNILTCPSCSGEVDVTGIEVASVIACPHCEHNFPVTQLFDKYLLLKKLGAGGMGAVYLAVKVLKPELSEDKKFTETFLHEAEITARLNHPNVVQVYTAGQQFNSYYLVMEVIEGGSLDDKIVEYSKITELEGIEVGIAVASGLKSAQEHGLVHRDIKPGNILFSTNNSPKVVDFGLSLDINSVDQFAGEIWGTPYYLPPEKLDGNTEDFRSDLYSLGATLFHAMTGRPPYDDPDPRRVAMMHLKGVAVSVKTFVPTISTQTAQAISQAMARYPNDRFQSYDAFIQQLEDAKRRLIGAEAAQEEVRPIEIVQTEATNQQNVYIIAGIIGLLLILVITIFVFRETLLKPKDAVPIELRNYDPSKDIIKKK